MTSSYPTAERPIDAIFVKEHARAAARHADVAVVHLDRIEDAPLLPVPMRADEDEFPTWRVAYRRKPAPLSYAANLVAAFRAYSRVRRSGFEPDVIHANFFLTGIPAVLLGRLHRKPVVLTEHWSVFLAEDPASLGRLMTRAARFAFEGADIVLPVSGALRDAIVRTTGARTRFRVVPNVVDEELFAPPCVRDAINDTARIVGVGDVYEPKGWDVLIEAVAELRGRRQDFIVDIVGEGPLEEVYRSRARELGLDGVVNFLGYRPKPEVASIMQGADLFVLPSRYENSPCAIGEALSTGVPVVATKVGGVPELVGDENGLLARAGDRQSLATQIERALDRSDLFDRSAIAAAARVRFGLATVGRTLAEVYTDVTQGRR